MSHLFSDHGREALRENEVTRERGAHPLSSPSYDIPSTEPDSGKSASSIDPSSPSLIAATSSGRATTPSYSVEIQDSEQYTVDLEVPANTLVEGNPGSRHSGVYKLVVTAFLNSTLGQPGFDISGFAEGPMIRVESPL